MSLAGCGGPGGHASRRHAAGRAADGLALAASPTFAVMAVVSGMLGDGTADVLCSAGSVSPLSGMATMYLLMSAFHVGPWLKLIQAGTGRAE